MGRRTVLLVVAVVVALLGVALVFVYVQGINDRARKGQETVEVLYTKAAIATGTTGADAQKAGAFESRQVPRDAVAAGALSGVTPIQSQIAVVPIAAGQPVVSSQWGSTAQASGSNGLTIPKGKLAVSVQLGDPERVAGFVTPGAYVAVLLSSNQTTGVIIPRAQVLAVGPSALAQAAGSSTGNTEQVPNTILTLALDQKAAQQLVFGKNNGTVQFALLSKTSATGKGSTTTPKNVFN
jgi:pilus assembly protein CpaB